MKQSKIGKKRLAIVLVISLITIFSVQAFAATLSGILDTYSGTGFSDAGQMSVDAFKVTDNTFYTKTEITASDRWPDAKAGLLLTPEIKGWLGYSDVDSKANPFTAYPTTGPVIQSFTGMDNGTYKIYFQSQYIENGLDFNGTVYDKYQ